MKKFKQYFEQQTKTPTTHAEWKEWWDRNVNKYQQLEFVEIKNSELEKVKANLAHLSREFTKTSFGGETMEVYRFDLGNCWIVLRMGIHAKVPVILGHTKKQFDELLKVHQEERRQATVVWNQL